MAIKDSFPALLSPTSSTDHRITISNERLRSCFAAPRTSRAHTDAPLSGSFPLIRTDWVALWRLPGHFIRLSRRAIQTTNCQHYLGGPTRADLSATGLVVRWRR